MNDLPEGFTRDEWEKLKAKHALMNAEYERAGGFHQWVLREEAERIAEDVGAYLASRPKGENAACSAWNWAFDLSVELAQINGWHVSDPRRREAEQQVLLAFEHGAASLPLLQSSGIEWGAAELPSNWQYTLLLRRDGLRAWALGHAPSLLGSGLLSESQAAPAERVAPIAETTQPALDWKAKAREIAKAKLAEDAAGPNGGTRGTLQYYAIHAEKELRRLGIKGSRGEWLTAPNIEREALRGQHWWNGGHPKD